MYCLRQHVTSPTHVHGHTLDLLITSDDQTVTVLHRCCRTSPTTSTSFRRVRNWRIFDVYAFADDLQSSDLITTPAIDVETGVDCYNSTPRALLDKHAPDELKRVTTR